MGPAATIGVPFAIYPSFIYYNKDLFKEAGLPYPPHKVGEQYDGKDWDMGAVRELAMKLTVDKARQRRHQRRLRRRQHRQWGFDMQYATTSPRLRRPCSAPGSLVADDGKTAQIPDNWRTGLAVVQRRRLEGSLHPERARSPATCWTAATPFQSGNLAMDYVHIWYTCCAWPADGEPQAKNFGMRRAAVLTTATTTAKLHADTFGILKSTTHPDEAFEVLTVPAGNVTGAASPSTARCRPIQSQQAASSTPRRALRAEQDRLAGRRRTCWPTRTSPAMRPDMPNFAQVGRGRARPSRPSYRTSRRARRRRRACDKLADDAAGHLRRRPSSHSAPSTGARRTASRRAPHPTPATSRRSR